MSQPAASASAYVASTSSALAVPDSTSRVERLATVPSWAARTAASVARSPSSGARTWSACTRTSSRAMCSPNTATRRRSAASRPSAMLPDVVRRRLASIRARSASELRRSRVARLVAAGELVVEPPPDRRQLAAVRLVRFRTAGLVAHPRQLALVMCDRGPQLVVDTPRACRRRRSRGRARAPRRGSAASASVRARPRALAIWSGVGVRVAVLVAADPRAERERQRSSPGSSSSSSATRSAVDVEQARLEEPQSLADLVVDARADRAHLVRLPQHVVSSATARSAARRSCRGRARVVERVEQRDRAGAGSAGRCGAPPRSGAPSAPARAACPRRARAGAPRRLPRPGSRRSPRRAGRVALPRSPPRGAGGGCGGAARRG